MNLVLLAGFFGIGATTRIGEEMLCLPYEGFFNRIDPPYACKLKTTTSRCCGDFWSKGVFLILARNDIIFKKKMHEKKLIFLLLFVLLPDQLRDSVLPISGIFQNLVSLMKTKFPFQYSVKYVHMSFFLKQLI